MLLLWLLFLVAVIVGLVFLIRALWPPLRERERPTDRPRRPESLSVLEERYARGEIDSDEFEERRRILRS